MYVLNTYCAKAIYAEGSEVIYINRIYHVRFSALFMSWTGAQLFRATARRSWLLDN